MGMSRSVTFSSVVNAPTRTPSHRFPQRGRYTTHCTSGRASKDSVSLSWLLSLSGDFFLIRGACAFIFFFNDTATTEIYTLSLHDALPISARPQRRRGVAGARLDRRSEHRA